METELADMTNDTRNTQTGQYAEKYPREAFLVALDEHDGAATSAEIAATVGCPRRTAYNRLDVMHEEGVLDKRAVGAAVLWILEDDSETEDSTGEPA